MGSSGSWMSPSVRMTAASGIGRQLATSLSCARSPSTSSVTAEQPRSACGRVASRLPGMMRTCCLYWLDNFMRRPWFALTARGSLVHTDEYGVYARLEGWGYQHKTVCHARGEYARDEDGDGFCEVHVNTMEGFWSLLRSWLRPHRGVSQEKLPLYLGFFEFVHNIRRRGKALLRSLIELLVAPRNTG